MVKGLEKREKKSKTQDWRIKPKSIEIKGQCYDIAWNPEVLKPKNSKIMLLSRCEECGIKKPKFNIDQKAFGL